MKAYDYRYKGAVPVKKGQKVEILDPVNEYPPMLATVETPLASQFTWHTAGRKQQGFASYADERATWRKVQ